MGDVRDDADGHGSDGAQTSPYCVKGSSLHLLEFDSGTMMKVVGDIILSKQ